MFLRRPTERHSPVFSAAERPVCVPYKRRGGARQAGGCRALPRGTELSGLCSDEVCVPYKRKPHRLNCRAAAPAASATINKQKITKRAFDGRALHRLELLLRVIFIRQFYDYPSPDRTSFARVFHRGTPGVRSLQEERNT